MNAPVVKEIRQHWWVVRAIADLETNIFACTAGLGSGKSHGAVQWHYDRVVLSPDVPRSAYVMPQYEHIHNTGIPTTRKVLEDYGMVEGADFYFVRSPFPMCVFPATRQEIHYLSATRPDKIKAVEYGHATMDEPGICKREAFDRLRERVRDKRAKANQILLAGTPEGTANWYAEQFDSDALAGWYKPSNLDHYIERRNLDGSTIRCRRFRLSTYDNEQFLPGGYIANLLDTYRNASAYVQAYIEGRFVPLITGGCYANYVPRLHDNPVDIEANPSLDIDFTWDFNADPLAWVAWQRRATEEYDERVLRRHAIHEANLNRGLLDDACIEFAVKFPVEQYRLTPIHLYGDSSGHAASHKREGSDYKEIRKLLKSFGYENVDVRAIRHNPLEIDTVNAMNRAFERDEVRINPRCTKTRQSFAATRWKEGERTIEKKAGEKTTHHSDACKYYFFVATGAQGRKVHALKH